jgi:hypothetical protein
MNSKDIILPKMFFHVSNQYSNNKIACRSWGMNICIKCYYAYREVFPSRSNKEGQVIDGLFHLWCFKSVIDHVALYLSKGNRTKVVKVKFWKFSRYFYSLIYKCYLIMLSLTRQNEFLWWIKILINVLVRQR